MQGKAASTGCGFDGGDTMKLKPPATAIKAEEEHQLRLRYTQHLQWRLVNAQAGAALSLQTTAAEVSDRVSISVLLGKTLRHDRCAENYSELWISCSLT